MRTGKRSHGSWAVLVFCAVLAIAGSASATRGRSIPGFSWSRNGRRPQLWEGLAEEPVPTGITLSPEGRWLAVASRDHPVHIWDTKTGKQQVELEGHLRPVSALAFSPDGRLLVTGDQYGEIRVWSAASWELRGRWKRDDCAVLNVTFGRDRTWFLTVSEDGTARVWDAATGEVRAVIRGHSSFCGYALAEHASAIAVASGDPPKLAVWDLPSPGRRPRAQHDWVDASHGFALSPNGRMLAVFQNGKIHLRSAERAREDDVAISVDGEVADLRFSPDGRTLAATSRSPVPWTGLWELSGSRLAMLRGRTSAGRAIRYSEDSQRLFSTGTTATAVLDVRRGKVQDELWGHVYPPTMFATAPGRFVTAAPDGFVAVWRTNDAEPVMTLPADLRKRFALLGGEEAHRNFCLADALQNGDTKEARRLLDHGADLRTCAFTGESTLMLAAWSDDCDLAQRSLAAGVGGNQHADKGATAFHYAAARGSARILRLLLRRFVDLTRDGELPERRVGRLRLRSGAPLLYAVCADSSEVVQMLLDAGERIDDANADGITPLQLAAAAGDAEMVDLLLAAGADVDGHFGEEEPMAYSPFADFWIPPPPPNNAVQTPLMLAAEDGQVRIVERLLAVGARTMLQDNEGRTALDRTRSALRKALPGADEEDPALARRLAAVLRLLTLKGAYR